MKIIALEEHYSYAALKEDVPQTPTGSPNNPYMEEIRVKLADLGEARLADMDKNGISMQILSISAMDESLENEITDETFIVKDANDRLAERISRNPDRYIGLATLPLRHPEEAAMELERCITKLGYVGAVVNGTVDGQFLDHPCFEPVLEAAERLDAPIYIHPAPPIKPIFDAYYAGLPGEASHALSISGWGWHTEAGLHALRLILAGVFDRHPHLHVIIGHMGEFLPYCLDRSDLLLSRAAPHLKKRLRDYFLENFHITTSGYFTLPPFLCALQMVGTERILFAVDYPYSPNAKGKEFLESLPIPKDQLELITHGNAEKLLRLRA